MNENDEKEIMTARKWIEFGKMYNNLIQDGWEVQFDTYEIDEGFRSVVGISPNPIIEFSSAPHATVYEAMTEVYFNNFLEEPNLKDIEQLSFNEEDMKTIYQLSDSQGITTNEVISNLFKTVDEYLNKSFKVTVQTTEAKCCFNCYFKPGGDNICCKHGMEIQFQNVCPDFKMVEQ